MTFRSLFSYEPEDILEYANVIGLDPVADKDLLYIAREGLKAPLPENWKPVYVVVCLSLMMRQRY